MRRSFIWYQSQTSGFPLSNGPIQSRCADLEILKFWGPTRLVQTNSSTVLPVTFSTVFLLFSRFLPSTRPFFFLIDLFLLKVLKFKAIWRGLQTWASALCLGYNLRGVYPREHETGPLESRHDYVSQFLFLETPTHCLIYTHHLLSSETSSNFYPLLVCSDLEHLIRQSDPNSTSNWLDEFRVHLHLIQLLHILPTDQWSQFASPPFLKTTNSQRIHPEFTPKDWSHTAPHLCYCHR